MKIARSFAAMIAGVALAVGMPAFAADDHGHGKDHDHGGEKSHFNVKAPETLKDAWALITAKVAEADAALGAKNLEVAHEAGEHLEAAVHTLEAKSDVVAADAKAKLASALKQADKAVDELHHAMEEKDADAAQGALAKLKGLLPLVEGLYPAGALK